MTVVRSSEEAGPEELAALSQDQEHRDVDQHSLQEELSPAAAEEAAVSPEDNPESVAPPEYPKPDDTKGAELPDADTVEPPTSDPEEVTEVDAASDDTGPAEISPDGTLEEIDPTGAVKGIHAIHPEASDDIEAETEEDSLGLEEDKHSTFETEGTSQEEAPSEQLPSPQPAVEVPGGLTYPENGQEEASPALLSDSVGETREPVAEENTEVAPAGEEPPPSVLEEHQSDVSLALGGRLETADDETAAEEEVVLSDDSVEDLEEMTPQVSAESADQEASEEHEQLETEENAEQNSPDSINLLEEDETVAVISDVDEESPEDPAATSVLSTTEEVEEMAQEEENLSASDPEGSEGTEGETEDVATPNSPTDSGASVVEEEVIFISDMDENNQEGATAAATLEEPEEVLEEMVLYVSTDVFQQEPLKEAEVETKVTSTPNIVPAAPKEDQTLMLTFDLDKKAAEVSATEEPLVSLLQEPVPEDLVLIAVLEGGGESSDSVQLGFRPEEAAAQPEDTEAGELDASGTAAGEPGEVQVPRTDPVMVPPVASDGGDTILQQTSFCLFIGRSLGSTS